MTKAPVFEVDRKGLAKLLARRGKEFIIAELLQNAWDEDGVTEVTIDFHQDAGHARLTVVDDAPEGFSDLSHAYTLFAESKKKGNAEKRGRFNLGEKLVIAIADRVQITTTKGSVYFDQDGRTMDRRRILAGSKVDVELRMNKDEADALRTLLYAMIPPSNIETYFNGSRLPHKTPDGQCFAQLPTEVADDEGYLKPTVRRTSVEFYPVAEGDKAMLYEMGIPVVETGDAWHVNVKQKVPLNSDRDNVTPSYLQKVRTITLNHMADLVKPEEAARPWVSAALEDKNVAVEAVQEIIKSRFGDKVVISDPSDPEGTKMAVAQGYTVLAPRTFSHDAWTNVKAAGVKPAGQVTPSPKPYQEGGREENRIPEEQWTSVMKQTADFASDLAFRLIGRDIKVNIVREPQINWVANFGPGAPLTLNFSRLGNSWFGQVGSEAQVALLLHEFAHDKYLDHLSLAFADEVARLGAKLTLYLADERFKGPSGRLDFT